MEKHLIMIYGKQLLVAIQTKTIRREFNFHFKQSRPYRLDNPQNVNVDTLHLNTSNTHL